MNSIWVDMNIAPRRRLSFILRVVFPIGAILTLSLLLARIITSNAPAGLSILVAFAIIPISLTWPEYGLSLMIVIMLKVFGLFGIMDLPNVRFPFGSLRMDDIVFLTMCVPLIRDILLKRVDRKISSLNKPLILFLIFALSQAARAFLIQSEDLHWILRLMRIPVYYLAFFLILYEIKDRTQLNRFLKLSFTIGIISGAVMALQYIFGLSLGGSALQPTSKTLGYDLPRIYNYTASLISSIFLMLLFTLPYIVGKVKVIIIFFEALLFISLLTTFARSLWGSIAIAMIIGLLIDVKNIGKFARYLVIAIFAIILSTNYFGSRIEGFLPAVSYRASTAIPDIIYKGGSVYRRILLFQRQWDIVRAENILLGVGFKYEPPQISQPGQIITVLDMSPYSYLGTDSGIVNLVFRFGLVGLILFAWLFTTLFRKSISVLKSIPPSIDRGILVGLVSTNIMIIISSFFGNWFFSSEAIVVVTSWALIELIKNFRWREAGLG